MPERTDLPLIVAPLRVEALALRSARAGLPVVHAGMRAGRASAVRRAEARHSAAPVVIAGLAGGLEQYLRPGDVVVPAQVRSPGAATGCPGGEAVTETLRRAGLPVHVGPVVESAHLVEGRERAELAGDGAVAVDTESARLLRMLGGHRTAVVRVVLDTPHRPLRHPATLSGVWPALRALRAIATALGRSGVNRPGAVGGEHRNDKENSNHRMPKEVRSG